MIKRINRVVPSNNFTLSVFFDDGRYVIYNVSDDMELPGYSVLKEITGLFQQVQLDESRTCVYWNEDVDLPSDIIYEYGYSVPLS
ncbi:MAG: DUF2442 domain-containing protein [Oscillospiraceae bacterium]|nr:DUF2442 domain-containing protein [Oscillospiraceae bacterium]